MKKLYIAGLVAVGVVALIAGGLSAQGADRVAACATCAPAVPPPGELPPVTGGGIQSIHQHPNGTSTLQLDDGTCESGLGVTGSTTVTSFQEFQVPSQCATGGLEVVAVTSRMNTYSAQSFALAQAGAAPPAGGFATTAAAFAGLGACPATAVNSVPLPGGSAVVTGTSTFWAGLVNTGFVGRDSNTPGNVWLNCAICDSTQYAPTTLSGRGVGGTWMIRVTVEDQNCVPVELLGVSIG